MVPRFGGRKLPAGGMPDYSQPGSWNPETTEHSEGKAAERTIAAAHAAFEARAAGDLWSVQDPAVGDYWAAVAAVAPPQPIPTMPGVLRYSIDASVEAAREFVSKLLANVPVFDGGGRGATTTFTQRDIGDVLVTFENEVNLILKEVGADKFEIVYPSISIEAAPPVAVVDKVVDKKGTRKQAEAYLSFLFTPEGQAIIAKHYLRPRDPAALAAAPLKPGPTRLFQVEKLIGEWKKVQAEHFSDGGIYDQISVKR
jgi:ABC-type Fe3+ transport system substrate-binding protein